MLGLDGKEQIEEYGLEPFIKHCKESVWKYKGMWEDFSSTVGFWADMEHPYVTYDNDFIESEWWALKQIWDFQQRNLRGYFPEYSIRRLRRKLFGSGKRIRFAPLHMQCIH